MDVKLGNDCNGREIMIEKDSQHGAEHTRVFRRCENNDDMLEWCYQRDFDFDGPNHVRWYGSSCPASQLVYC